MAQKYIVSFISSLLLSTKIEKTNNIQWNVPINFLTIPAESGKRRNFFLLF